jgi:hypothetical protein
MCWFDALESCRSSFVHLFPGTARSAWGTTGSKYSSSDTEEELCASDFSSFALTTLAVGSLTLSGEEGSVKSKSEGRQPTSSLIFPGQFLNIESVATVTDHARMPFVIISPCVILCKSEKSSAVKCSQVNAQKWDFSQVS